MLMIPLSRITLRTIKIEDALDILEYMSNHEVTQYLYRRCESLDECERYIRVEFLSYRQQGIPEPFSIVLDEKVIGTCNYHTVEDENAEIGFILNPKYQHQGYMKEALEGLIEYGFEKLGYHRIEAKVMVDNQPSISLLEKLQFKKEGVLREVAKKNEQYFDLVLYSLLENEWRNQHE